MQQHNRFAMRVTALLIIKLVQIGNAQPSGEIGLTLGIGFAQLGHALILML
jgi:hypothetical protein